MATFLVTHGAWGGGWSWKRLHPLLRARGHDLYTPTYTGLGERAHLLNPSLDLQSHVEDVVAVLEYEDLRDVTLLGHSYGGIVATGVVDRVPERVAQLIYLDAFVPRDGQSLLDLVPEAERARRRALSEEAGEGWLIPPGPPPADTPAEDLPWLAARRRPQPRRTFEQPLALTRGEPTLPRTYIYCTRAGPLDQFRQFAERARTEPGWRCFEIDSSHTPNVTAPEALADLLDRIVSTAG